MGGIHLAVREACQSKIDQRILTTNPRMNLNPNLRQSGLHNHIYKYIKIKRHNVLDLKKVKINPKHIFKIFERS